jgi:hypothetical protein
MRAPTALVRGVEARRLICILDTTTSLCKYNSLAPSKCVSASRFQQMVTTRVVAQALDQFRTHPQADLGLIALLKLLRFDANRIAIRTWAC